MPSSMYLALVAGLVFFVVIPIIGAFHVRNSWRKFRLQCLSLRQCQELSLDSRIDDYWSGLVYGELEGIEGRAAIWIRSNGLSIRVPMEGSKIWLLQENYLELQDRRAPQRPLALTLNDLGAMPEGTGVLVHGTLYRSAGLLTLVRTDIKNPLVVLFEGDSSTVIKRLVWSGRQQNEYWNVVTPLSLLLGFAILGFLSLVGLTESSNLLWSILMATTSVMPFSVLLPPGLLGFMMYRRFWRSARFYRGVKDLVVNGFISPSEILALAALRKDLPVSEGIVLPYMGSKIRRMELIAVGSFIIALVINSYMVFWLLAQLAGTR